MHYDPTFFDTPIDRMGTASEKWDGLRGREGAGVLPMWVADMDFRCAEEITQALQARAAHPVYGYTYETDSNLEAMLGFVKRRHGISLAKDEQLIMSCVVTGLKAGIRALTRPGDKVIIQPPVYGPFSASTELNGRVLAENPLQRDEQGRYTMDFDGLERLCKAGAKLMLLCNPHNPACRVWTREELTRLLEILARYRVALLSDEIHWDFVYEKDAFTSVLALPAAQGKEAEIAVLTSASKTFNLAGLQQSVLFCRNPGMMRAVADELQKTGNIAGNIFALVATEAAYRYGDAWLDGLMDYLGQSRAVLREELAERLPKAILSPIEATYVGWIDLRAYGFSTQELMRRTHAKDVAFTEGTFFGKEAGEGFLRVVCACPHAQVREAIRRLEIAIKGDLSF